MYIWLVVSKIFYFHPYLGKIPSLANIFQGGWFNHQLDIYRIYFTHSHIDQYDSPMIFFYQLQSLQQLAVPLPLSILRVEYLSRRVTYSPGN